MKKEMLVFGIRQEAIKIGPLVLELKKLGNEAKQMINTAISAAYKYECANDGLFPMRKQVRLVI